MKHVMQLTRHAAAHDHVARRRGWSRRRPGCTEHVSDCGGRWLRRRTSRQRCRPRHAPDGYRTAASARLGDNAAPRTAPSHTRHPRTTPTSRHGRGAVGRRPARPEHRRTRYSTHGSPTSRPPAARRRSTSSRRSPNSPTRRAWRCSAPPTTWRRRTDSPALPPPWTTGRSSATSRPSGRAARMAGPNGQAARVTPPNSRAARVTRPDNRAARMARPNSRAVRMTPPGGRSLPRGRAGALAGATARGGYGGAAPRLRCVTPLVPT